MKALINALDELAHTSPTDTTEAREELAAIIKAGWRIANQLRENKRVVDLGNSTHKWAFIDEDAAALEAWEQATKE